MRTVGIRAAPAGPKLHSPSQEGSYHCNPLEVCVHSRSAPRPNCQDSYRPLQQIKRPLQKRAIVDETRLRRRFWFRGSESTSEASLECLSSGAGEGLHLKGAALLQHSKELACTPGPLNACNSLTYITSSVPHDRTVIPGGSAPVDNIPTVRSQSSERRRLTAVCGPFLRMPPRP
jgi:hypothetical protein